MTEATLKPGWTKVKFGEVVRLCKDRSSNPEAEGIERYVGLEHLEPEDLRVRSWGLVTDGTTFTSRFKPGQVLFGKRRAYQRKVAIADFAGICSGDIYVFESADPKHLLPELLPFICQTDRFLDYAVGTSAGSLSPRTNWKNLKDFEFYLPTLDTQENLLQTLNALKKLSEAYYIAKEKSWKNLESDLVATLDHGKKPLQEVPAGLPNGWEFLPLGELIKIKHGYAFSGDFFSDTVEGENPILLTPKNFSVSGTLNFDDEKTKYYTSSFPDEYWLSPGELVILMTDLTPSARLLGAPGIVDRPALHNQRIGLIEISDTDRVCRDFLFFSFLGEQLRRLIRALSTGSTVNHTSPKTIQRLCIPLPSKTTQSDLVNRWWSIYKAYKSLADRYERSKKLLTIIRESNLQ